MHHPNVTVLETNSKKFLHTKAFISRNHGIQIGSCNFDSWSMYINDELNLQIMNPHMANNIWYKLNGQLSDLSVINQFQEHP